MVKIYTDGACSGNPGKGGAGIVILEVQNSEEKLTNYFNIYFNDTTNQRMEIYAAIAGLQKLNSNDLVDLDTSIIEIYSDSAYLCNAFNQNWIDNWQKNGWINSKKQPVANKDLWELLLQTIDLFNHSRISFIKVKGHNGNKYNEMADKLAVAAIKGVNNK